MSPVVSAKSHTHRIFQSNFLEFFTRVHWSVPLLMFVPVIVYCFFRSLQHPPPLVINYFKSLTAGFLIWTLFEYLFHRFIFHFQPKNSSLKKALYLLHEVHHEYPNDRLRLVLPPVESILFAILAYFIIHSLLPLRVFYPFVMGFTAGYLTYDMVHYSVHHRAMKGELASFFKQHHLRHHFQEEDRGFGVSSPLWDYIFGTYYRNKVATESVRTRNQAVG
jgi:sterol desaturase/sphingolipid hydroxylase (fatty acid hydroxylase superfamily)